MYSNDLGCHILDFLDNNLYRKVSIEELSSCFYYNRYYIMKLFKKYKKNQKPVGVPALKRSIF